MQLVRFYIVKNTFGERNNTFCDKTLNKCIANDFFFFFLYFVTLIINIESVFLFIGYMTAFWRDSNACSHSCSAFYIYGSKVGAHYRSTLFSDLNLEITKFRRHRVKKYFIGQLVWDYRILMVFYGLCNKLTVSLNIFSNSSMSLTSIIILIIFFSATFNGSVNHNNYEIKSFKFPSVSLKGVTVNI